MIMMIAVVNAQEPSYVRSGQGKDCIIQFNPDGTLPGAKAVQKAVAVDAFKSLGMRLGYAAFWTA